MPENTFDIVSKIDLQEVSNAIQQAMKEITTRFDLKDSKSSIALEGKENIMRTKQASYVQEVVALVGMAPREADRTRWKRRSRRGADDLRHWAGANGLSLGGDRRQNENCRQTYSSEHHFFPSFF